MKITVSEILRDSKLIIINTLFNHNQNKCQTARELGLSVRTIRSLLKKPLPVIINPVTIDIANKTWADIDKELIVNMLELCNGHIANTCKRLGLARCGLRLKRSYIETRDIALIDISKLKDYFSKGHTIKELSDIFLVSTGTIWNSLQKHIYYEEYDKQIKENYFIRAQRRHKKLTMDRDSAIMS